MNKNFICTECKCEDNILELKVVDGITHTFRFNDDLTLEHRDSDGNGQEIYLQCYECGQKYEFKNDFSKYALELHEVFSLKKFIFGSGKEENINSECLKFEKKENTFRVITTPMDVQSIEVTEDNKGSEYWE